jgi:hypothetical protein
MVGFPRSGTTLLENVLAAHPRIETLEEIPSLDMALHHLDRMRARSVPSAEIAAEARARFYREIDRRRRKPDAAIVVDKLPIRSAHARLLRRLFPEQRFIFSIRHPFDVVLSCFRHHFAPNAAMENFRTVAGTVETYDFVMRQWFDVHGMDDPAVCYVRYDDLVTDFEPTVGRIMDFLGVGWSADVLQFAEHAAGRKAQTPSYRKVRQGLTLGVQSSWRNYRFLFEAPSAKPLYKWAEFFGYEVE